jgi:hypothetical protein
MFKKMHVYEARRDAPLGTNMNAPWRWTGVPRYKCSAITRSTRSASSDALTVCSDSLLNAATLCGWYVPRLSLKAVIVLPWSDFGQKLRRPLVASMVQQQSCLCGFFKLGYRFANFQHIEDAVQHNAVHYVEQLSENDLSFLFVPFVKEMYQPKL